MLRTLPPGAHAAPLMPPAPCCPPGLHKDPPEFDMVWARQEAELVMFNAVADLLAKTGLKPRQIDVLGGCGVRGAGCVLAKGGFKPRQIDVLGGRGQGAWLRRASAGGAPACTSERGRAAVCCQQVDLRPGNCDVLSAQGIVDRSMQHRLCF